MKKFLSLFLGIFLVLFSAGMAFVVGDYMGAKAQKDHDSLERADLSSALVKAVAQFNACEAQDDYLGKTFNTPQVQYNHAFPPEKKIP
jgi:hypothetical protein